MFYNWLPDSTLQDGNSDNLNSQNWLLLFSLDTEYRWWNNARTGVREGAVTEVVGEAGVWGVNFYWIIFFLMSNITVHE